MHTDPAHAGDKHHKNRHLAERFEGMLGMVMIAAIVVLAVGLIWGIMATGSPEPKWMQ